MKKKSPFFLLLLSPVLLFLCAPVFAQSGPSVSSAAVGKSGLALQPGMTAASNAPGDAGLAGNTGQDPYAAMGNPGPPHTLLWKISGKGLKKPSYLFGTMHVLCEDDAVLSARFKAAIADCDEVYFEINLVDLSSILNSLKFMRMNDNRKLSDLLNDSDYHKVRNYFNTHGSKLPFGMLERLKPMLVSSLIEEDNMNCKSTDGMEFVIMKEARDHDKKINGFETAEFQAGLFDSIPYEQQARELVESIDSVDANKKNTDSLVAVYKRQDLEKIDEMSRKEDPGMEGYMDLLLYSRNRKWVKMLPPLLADKSLVIAVGAAHLPGSQGVINLLRKAGYTLEPVKN